METSGRVKVGRDVLSGGSVEVEGDGLSLRVERRESRVEDGNTTAWGVVERVERGD